MSGVNVDIVHTIDPNVTYEGSTLEQLKARMNQVQKTVVTEKRFWSEDNSI